MSKHMAAIEDLSKRLSLSLNKEDDLSRIEKEAGIELILNNAKDKGYLDTGLFIELSLTGIPFIGYLKEYKNISSDEAKALISYGYVTFEDMVRILNSGIEGSDRTNG